MTANFENDLKFSFEDFDERKKFYHSIGLQDVKFVGYDTDEDKSAQKCDIDVRTTFFGEEVGISEKIRRRTYSGDILIEVYSIFEKGVSGWLKESKADILACFFIDKIVFVKVGTLKDYLHRFADEHKDFIKSIWSTACEMVENSKIYERLDGFENIYVTVAKNKGYHTVSIIVKTKDLIDNGVEIEEFEQKSVE